MYSYSMANMKGTHTHGFGPNKTLVAQLGLGSETEPSSKLSQCEMPQCVRIRGDIGISQHGPFLDKEEFHMNSLLWNKPSYIELKSCYVHFHLSQYNLHSCHFLCS